MALLKGKSKLTESEWNEKAYYANIAMEHTLHGGNEKMALGFCPPLYKGR